MKKHPIQPTEKDKSGVLRFKKNAIVEYILNNGGLDLNDLACKNFSQEDREQFAQLIGYSLCGFADLSYASEETIRAAKIMADTEKTHEEARIEALEHILTEIKSGLRSAAAAAFNKHPDDLQ